MKRLVFLFATTICLFAWSCNKADTNSTTLEDWETALINTPANAEHMAAFLENAHKGVVYETTHMYSVGGKSYVNDPERPMPGAGITTYLIDEDGTARISSLSHAGYGEVRVCNWYVSKENPMILNFTDQKGNEDVSRLISFSDGYYYFEDVYPSMSGATYDRHILCAFINIDPERRAEVEALFEKAKAENE